MRFKGQVVIITGGSAGIGAATAILFAKEGANIVIVARNEERLRNTAKRCEEHGATTLLIKADVGIEKEVNLIVQKTIDKFGRLDVLVNNAAAVKPGSLLSGNLLESYDEMLNTNLRAVVQLTNLATPYLLKTKGCIVNISSVSANKYVNENFKFLGYCVSKAGLNHFTRGIALELGPLGVRANIVSPGPVNTSMLLGSNMAGSVDDFKAMTVLDRVSSAEEIADVIVFLASDKAKSITGAEISVDNGVAIKN